MVKNTQMLRMTYEEMFYAESILTLAVEHPESPRGSHSYKVIKSARDKIVAALDQAQRDGLIDIKAIARRMKEVPRE